MDYLLLIALWSGWCLLHSVLASVRVNTALRVRLGAYFRYYRLFYNLFAVISLVPVVLYSSLLQGVPFFVWSGFWQLLQWSMIVVALLMFYLPLRRYDMDQFLGLRQIRSGLSHAALSTAGSLDSGGILGCVRHPWYSAGILLIWARDLDMSVFLVNVILSTYLIVGAFIEEKKLLAELGEEYRQYRRRVPMFIPYRCFFLAKQE